MRRMGTPLVLSREQARRLDQLAIERYGISGLVLMENAGRGAAEALRAYERSLSASSENLAGSPYGPGPEGVALRLVGGGGAERGFVVVLCGKGNNAGDGFVMARHLEILGVEVKVELLFPTEELRGDARVNFEILRRTDVGIVEMKSEAKTQAEMTRLLDVHGRGAAWVVYAMWGTGARGEPRFPLDAAICWMNAQPSRRLAVDVPSGLDCDTGVPAAATVRADLTCTFVAAKPGFFRPQAREFLGEVRVVEIGVPPRLVREAAGV
jgi:NAD(P)H-hydrate epimerase